MTADRARDVVYADLVAALLAAHRDPAGARFDTDLRAHVAAGEVSPAAAADLARWHGTAIEALTEHIRTVLPPALEALERAEQHTAETYDGEDAHVDAEELPSTEPADLPRRLGDRRRMIVAGLTTVQPDITLDLTRAPRGQREA
jgi:hypothetical protein